MSLQMQQAVDKGGNVAMDLGHRAVYDLANIAGASEAIPSQFVPSKKPNWIAI
jgi:hypothetical protein